MRARLENGLSGFIHTRNLSDKHVSAPEERVHVSSVELESVSKCIYVIVCMYIMCVDWYDHTLPNSES